MTYFLAYFETKNPSSDNFSGFSDVGRYTLPTRIFGGTVDVSLDGKLIQASVITDFSGQAANDYLLSRGKEERKELLRFIQGRLRNSCVTACLVGYIEMGQETIYANEKKQIALADLEMQLLEPPLVNTCFEITDFHAPSV